MRVVCPNCRKTLRIKIGAHVQRVLNRAEEGETEKSMERKAQEQRHWDKMWHHFHEIFNLRNPWKTKG